MSVLSTSALEGALGKAVKAQNLAPLWVVYGAEQLLAIEAASAIRAAARALGATERTVIDADGRTDWSLIEGAAASQSLFGERKIIEVRLASGKPGKSGEASLARLPSLMKDLEGTTLIVELPDVDWQTQKKAWWQSLVTRAQAVECRPVDRARLPAWIGARLARNGQKATPEAIEFIACQTEGNLLATHQEIEKLAILGSENPLTLDAVRDAILNVSRHNVSDIEEALLAGNPSRVARTVDGLEKEGEAMPRVLWIVADLVRSLLALRVGGQGPRGPSWRIASLRTAAQAIPEPMLTQALARCAAIDRISKGLTDPACDTNEWTELKAVLTALARRVAARKSR